MARRRFLLGTVGRSLELMTVHGSHLARAGIRLCERCSRSQKQAERVHLTFIRVDGLGDSRTFASSALGFGRYGGVPLLDDGHRALARRVTVGAGIGTA